jgi:hypothetical protein
MTARLRIEFGTPVPDNAIPVIILAAEQADLRPENEAPLPEEPVEEEIEPEQVRDEIVEEEIPPPPPQPEPEPQPEPDPEAEEPTLEEELANGATSFALPEVALPEGEGGGPSGVVAIFCPDLFDDPDKAAECAGRDVRSGWERTDEDWSGIVQALRRGGVNVPDSPAYGPDWREPLAPNETYYEPQDLAAIVGAKRARQIELARKGRWLKEGQEGTFQRTNPVTQSNSNFGIGTPYFLESWQPTWSQREDPSVSTQDLEELKEYYDSGQE